MGVHRHRSNSAGEEYSRVRQCKNGYPRAGHSSVGKTLGYVFVRILIQRCGERGWNWYAAELNGLLYGCIVTIQYSVYATT